MIKEMVAALGILLIAGSAKAINVDDIDYLIHAPGCELTPDIILQALEKVNEKITIPELRESGKAKLEETRQKISEWYKPVIILDTDFVTVEGSAYSPKSCKGNLCWTWKVERNPLRQDQMTVFTSDLQFRISEAKRFSKSVVDSVKNSNTKAVNSGRTETYSFLNDKAISDAVTNSVSRATTKERARSTFESSEFSYEWNLNAIFHSFLAKAIAPVDGAWKYPFCISGAVDLYFQFLQRGEVEKLVKAFIMYKSFSPEKVEKLKVPGAEKTEFDRAVRLYRTFLEKVSLDSADEVGMIITKDRLWAKACLFSYILSLEERK